MIATPPQFDDPTQDQLPPHDVALERAVLGAILLDADPRTGAIARLDPPLDTGTFHLTAHAEIYRAARTCHNAGQPTDLITVAAALRRASALEAIGGTAALASLLDGTISAAAVDLHAAALRELATRRELRMAGDRLCRLAHSRATSGGDLIATAHDVLDRALGTATTASTLTPCSDLLAETFTEIELRSRGMVLPGVPCGFYDLDAMTQGFQRGDLVIAAGRPSMGKTAWALGVARNIAAGQKLPVAIFSLEMSKQQLVYRLLSSEVAMETSRLRTGRIAQHEWEPLGQAISVLSHMPIHIDDTPMVTVAEMRAKARRLHAQQGGALGLIIIDYLQLMGEGGDNRVQELSKITRSLKGLARELNVPIIALSQLNRGVESRTNKRPVMSDLRDSGGLEQDADVILMLYREEYYDPDTADRGLAEVIITKHRNGPTGTVKLLFEPQFTRFRNLPP
jgi:replicative DNA helicase